MGSMSPRGIGLTVDVIPQYDILMRGEQQQILDKIAAKPERSDIPWKDIEALLVSLGGEISEGRGSRVRIYLNGVRAVFHRPHPKRVTDKGAVRSMRKFLKEAKVIP